MMMKPLSEFFREMTLKNEPIETFEIALTIVGIAVQNGDMNKVDLLLREMDTAPREYLMDALEESGFQL